MSDASIASSATATHLWGEVVLIELPHAYMVSDHPVAVGGTGKGPSPGELMLAALTSSAAMLARRVSHEAATVSAMALFRSGYQVTHGPMAAIGYVLSARLRLEPGARTERRLVDNLLAQSPVAAAMRQGVRIEDTTQHTGFNVPRAHLPRAARNEVLMAQEQSARARSKGEEVLGPEEKEWRVRAESKEPGACTVSLARQHVLLDEAAGGPIPTPFDLLVAAVAVSSAIHVARHAAFHGFALERARVSVSGNAAHMQRRTEIAGDLSPDQFEILKFCSERSALGESLQRGMKLSEEIS